MPPHTALTYSRSLWYSRPHWKSQATGTVQHHWFRDDTSGQLDEPIAIYPLFAFATRRADIPSRYRRTI